MLNWLPDPLHPAVATLALLSVSSWAAVETGETTAEQVEQVVAEAPLETHEERAETLLTLTVVVLGVGLAGFAPGVIGLGARALATLATVGLMVAGYAVGHSGGELVYRHGAASVYAESAGAGGAMVPRDDRSASTSARSTQSC